MRSLDIEMITLTDLGGIQVHGPGAEAWMTPDARFIQGYPVTFDSDEYTPHARDDAFVFPANRGQNNYKVDLLTDGTVTVLKEDRIYLCAVIKGRPRVLNYRVVPSDQLLTGMLNSPL
jgi:hypothetical protein